MRASGAIFWRGQIDALMVFLLFLAGLALLVLGAEALVRGASRLAAAVGVSPLVIGLTVVAFGTSAPELTVSVIASLRGQAGADVALGNVVGSNIFNVLFILGVSALITPLAVAQKLVRIDMPIMIALSGLIYLLALDGQISRVEGILLFAGILTYTAFAVVQGRRESRAVLLEYTAGLPDAARPADEQPRRLWGQAGLIVGGLVLLVIGSRWLVDGAITMARAFGVSELIISLTIVAAGTSLPEVATSVMASIRGERDIAVGNVVGRNIFNILAVLGLAAMIGPAGIGVSQAALGFDIPVMTATALACLPIFFSGYRIGRLEGFVFLTYYAAYLLYLILASTRHDALPLYSSVMLYFTVPATVVVLGAAAWRGRKYGGIV